MRILGIVLGLCLITTFAFAEVTGEIISIDKDANGNIRVWTQYKVDGVEVESNYPKIDGKAVFCTRYNKQSFLGMNKKKIAKRIDKDIKTHTESLTQKEYDKNAEKTVRQLQIENNRQVNQDFLDSGFPSIVGRKVTTKSTKVKINDKEYTLTTDGTIVPMQ